MTREERPRMKRAAPVKALLEKIFRDKGLDGRLREFQTWIVWDETVGPQIAARARPLRIRDGVLEVAVDHPVWMQQLQLLKPRLLTQLNQRLGEEVLKDLFLRLGRKKPPEEAPDAPPSPEWRSVILDAAEKESIEALLAPLADPELREQMRRVLERQARLEKASKKDYPPSP